MDFPAPRLDTVAIHEVADALRRLVRETGAEEVYLPHRGDVHLDHQVAYRAGLIAVRPLGADRVRRVLCYETLSETEWASPEGDAAFIPTVFVDVGDHVDDKVDAMRCYSSQLKDDPHPRSESGIRALARFRGATAGVLAAEAFMLIREVQGAPQDGASPGAPMNVLVTSAGRRTSLLEAFREAAHARGGRVWAGDLDGLAPALFLADEAVRLPRVTGADYLPALFDLVEQHAIRLVVPTIDTELPALAGARDALEALGCRLATSTADLVRISGDKWATYEAAQRTGIPTMRSWLPDALDGEALPEALFVKPRNGSASQHTYAASPETLPAVLVRVPRPIVQERIGGDEVTVDALFDFDGRLLHFVPRRRVRTVGGESIQGVTLREGRLNGWLESVLGRLGALGARGPVTAQAFDTDGQFLLLEVNPRFGGGFPLGHAAGARYPEWLLALVAGEDVPPRLGEYEDGLYMTRYYVERFTREPAW